jgi:GNAT superfamily N-acetyltransferase
MNETESLRIEAANSTHATPLCALFERNCSACYCQWWHFSGDKNAWQDRLAHAPAENQRALLALLEAEPMTGVVAFDADTLVGYMKLCPAARIPKLYDQRLYRKLPCFAGDRTAVYSIGCMLVDEPWRRRGVAEALLHAGLSIAREAGATSIEAFPRRASELGDAELWMGPFSAFLKAGFEVVNDFGPYPVLRVTLR